MKALVTGHKGYIGSHIYSELLNQGHEVYGVDLKEGQDLLHYMPDVEVDVVFHTAALPRVGFSVIHPSYTLMHNTLGTSKVLEWAKKNKVKRFVFSSSSAVYGNGEGPNSPYGLHKSMSEQECLLYSNLYNLDTVCLRYFNVYSEDQEYGGSYSTVIAAWMHFLNQRSEIRIEGDGEQTRDFIHVQDIVSANLFCANYEQNFNGQCFDVGVGEAVSINYIKDFILQNRDVKVVNVSPREGDVRNTLAKPKPLERLGWKSKIKIQDGLKKCF